MPSAPTGGKDNVARGVRETLGLLGTHAMRTEASPSHSEERKVLIDGKHMQSKLGSENRNVLGNRNRKTLVRAHDVGRRNVFRKKHFLLSTEGGGVP